LEVKVHLEGKAHHSILPHKVGVVVTNHGKTSNILMIQVVVVRFKLTLQLDSRITAFSGQSTTVPWVCTEKLR